MTKDRTAVGIARRQLLVGASASAAASGLASPAIAVGIRRLNLVTDWPEGPGLLPSARRMADTINRMTEGRLEIEVTASGEVVRPLETFDAVQSGVVDMFHSHIGYFEDRSPTFAFYSGLPFGLTVGELYAWVRFGGGQRYWDLAAAEFNIKPFFCSTTGAQMGGWFLREINTVEDLKGLRYRMAGPGAEVFRRLGAAVVLLPAADIVPSLRSGAVDACEWVGPWLDIEMGLDQIAPYYYYPGWHEPGGALTLGINNDVWNTLTESERLAIETAAASEYVTSLAEFTVNNANALQRLKHEGRVNLMGFSDDLLSAFRALSTQVVDEIGSSDSLARATLESYDGFRRAAADWSQITAGAFLATRGSRG